MRSFALLAVFAAAVLATGSASANAQSLQPLANWLQAEGEQEDMLAELAVHLNVKQFTPIHVITPGKTATSYGAEGAGVFERDGKKLILFFYAVNEPTPFVVLARRVVDLDGKTVHPDFWIGPNNRKIGTDVPDEFRKKLDTVVATFMAKVPSKFK